MRPEPERSHDKQTNAGGAAHRRRRRRQARGALLIVGGAEDKLGECSILRTFVQLAGGPKAKIAVLPMASNHPLETGERYSGLFHSLGAAEVQVLHLDDRDAADEPEAVKAIEQVGGI